MHRHGPTDAILLRVAFATARHALMALGGMRLRSDLFTVAELHSCPVSRHDLPLLDIQARHETRRQVITLVEGLHGVVIRQGKCLVRPDTADEVRLD
jgi:hypothetical protein